MVNFILNMYIRLFYKRDQLDWSTLLPLEEMLQHNDFKDNEKESCSLICGYNKQQGNHYGRLKGDYGMI